MKLDFINSWKKGNKKVWVADICFRLGRITVFEMYCSFDLKFMRLIILNFGAELTY